MSEIIDEGNSMKSDGLNKKLYMKAIKMLKILYLKLKYWHLNDCFYFYFYFHFNFFLSKYTNLLNLDNLDKKIILKYFELNC